MSSAASISRVLRTLADFAEIRGATRDAVDLRRAADSIAAVNPAAASALIQRARRERLTAESGIAPELSGTLRDLALGGEDAVVGAAVASLPNLYKALLELRMLEPAEGALLVRQLGLVTLGDFLNALETGRLRQTVGGEMEARLRQAGPLLSAETPMVSLGRARDLLESLGSAIQGTAASIDLILMSGDARRFESLVSELILVARAVEPSDAIEQLCFSRGAEEVRHRGPRRVILTVQQAEVDVRVAAPDEFGTVLFSTTGSRAHLAAMRTRGHLRLVAREEDLYALSGLAFVPPELREGTGELDAAAAGRLPALVSREHIRGDLHMHTIYSDGMDTLETMVAACAALGYEYIAITDHSERAAAARTLSRRDLSRQRGEIEVLRERYPNMTILHGVEADIMPDGSLDFPDRILETLDIVLASLHDSARQDGKTLTRRCIQAIRHPLVTIVTHPANRIVGRRTAYPMDFDAIYRAAAETGTALEVDGAPAHLDLDGEHARAAVAAGVTVTIDSDCHRARALDRQMELGIGTARRGWVEPRHVLNTRPVAELRAFIAAKRGAR